MRVQGPRLHFELSCDYEAVALSVGLVLTCHHHGLGDHGNDGLFRGIAGNRTVFPGDKPRQTQPSQSVFCNGVESTG